MTRRTPDAAKAVLAGLAYVVISTVTSAQDGPQIAVPKLGDTYSKLVARAEAGETAIDYTELRESLLKSAQFRVAASADLGALRQRLHEAMRKSDHAAVLDVTARILSLDYTDMEAHKIRQQTYKMRGDTANQKKYHDIEFGLLNSIIKKGDGKTCQTAWPVVQVTEEYFILNMLGAKLLQQSIDSTGGLCDKMEVQTDEGNKTYFFDTKKVFESYKKPGERP